MAVARSAIKAPVSSTAIAGTQTVASFMTVGATDTFLLVGFEVDSATIGTPVAHWDSAGSNQLMTQIGTTLVNSTSSPAMSMFWMGVVNPTAGLKSISYSCPGLGGSTNCYLTGITFTGTQTASVAAAIYAFASNQGSAANATVSSASAILSGDMAVTAYNNIPGFTNAFTAGTNPGDGGSAIGKNESLTTNMASESYVGAGAVINSSAANASSAQFAAIIVGIAAAAAASAGPGRTTASIFRPGQGPTRGLKTARSTYIPLLSTVFPAANTLAVVSPAIDVPVFNQVDNFTAASLTVAAPGIGAPTGGYVLSPTAIAVASTSIGTPLGGYSFANIAAFAPGSPVIGTPIGGYTFAPTPTLAVGSPAIGVPALVQVVASVASNLAVGSPAIGVPTSGSNHTATSLAVSSPAIGSAAFNQAAALSVPTLAVGSPVLGHPTAYGWVPLTLAPASPVFTAPVIKQTQVLAVSNWVITGPDINGTAPNMSGAIAIGAVALVPAGLTFQAIGLSQRHGLVAVSATVASPALDAAVLGSSAGSAAISLATGSPVLGTPLAGIITAAISAILADRVLDLGLAILDTEATHVSICSAKPTTHAEASSTFMLGIKAFSIGAVFGGPASGTAPTGRRISSLAFSDGNVLVSGVATWWAVYDNVNTRLLAAGQLTTPTAVVALNRFGLGSFDIKITNALSQATSVMGAVSLSTSSPSIGTPLLPGAAIMPADRNFAWNPGLMSQGGIPTGYTQHGATLTPSGGEDTNAIQAALDGASPNQYVLLGPGVFLVSQSQNPIFVPNGVVLRGSGAGVTTIRKTGSGAALPRTASLVPGTNIRQPATQPGTLDNAPIILVGPGRWASYDQTGGTATLTADGIAGQNSITVDNPGLFTVGACVLLDELSGATYQPTPPGFLNNNANGTEGTVQVLMGDRVAWNIHNPNQQFQDDPPDAYGWFTRPTPIGADPGSYTDGAATCEIKEIASKVGNVITFTSPLTITYRTSHRAQLTRYSNSPSTGNSVHIRGAGVEKLTVQYSGGGGIFLTCCAYCWVKNVEVDSCFGLGISLAGCFRCEVRDSYIHTSAQPTPAADSYAVNPLNGSSELLIENNIMTDYTKVIAFRSAGAGTVVAYNYTDNGWDWYGTSSMQQYAEWQECGINASHMAGPHHVLFEGNRSFNFDSDYTHGNSIYMVIFRNHLIGARKDFTNEANARCGGGAMYSWWLTFIGNVMGVAGQMSGWTYTDARMGCDVNGNNCVGAPTSGWTNGTFWNNKSIWRIAYDPERWACNPDSKSMTTMIRDGNYDHLTSSQRWHNTPAGFTIPNSLYLTSKPAFFGANSWPWVDPATGATATLPAKQRYDAGTPNTVT